MTKLVHPNTVKEGSRPFHSIDDGGKTYASNEAGEFDVPAGEAEGVKSRFGLVERNPAPEK